MSAFTDEQDAAICAFLEGDNLAVEAGAGTGKTTTLVGMAELKRTSGQYVAFNKAIVAEAGAKLPDHCRSSTMHSLAARAVGRAFMPRLMTGRKRGWEIARHLGIGACDLGERRLAAGWCGSTVMRAMTNFTFSADPEPTRAHIGRIQALESSETGDRNHDLLGDHLEPFLGKAWADLCDPGGRLPYSHDCYLKFWQLRGAAIPADYILVDEAQDLSPVFIDILAQQEHAQVVWVGDSQQEIYGWRGCRNALAAFDGTRMFLTGAFRFGEEIAEQANIVLEQLPTELRLRGLGGPSALRRLSQPDAVICRSNGGAVVRLLQALGDGRQPVLLGGAGQILAFCRAALSLQASRPTEHAELGCFSDWRSVQDYVANDPQGSDLALMVRLVDRFGAEALMEALERSEAAATHDVVIATAHKAKGKEWETVALHDDFSRAIMGPEEWRCLYVAITRARKFLDLGRVAI